MGTRPLDANRPKSSSFSPLRSLGMTDFIVINLRLAEEKILTLEAIYPRNLAIKSWGWTGLAKISNS
jgi:hypothetical protein